MSWIVEYSDGETNLAQPVQSKEQAIALACRALAEGSFVISVTPPDDALAEKPISMSEIQSIVAAQRHAS